MLFAKKVHVNLFSAQNQILKSMSYVTAGKNPFVKYLVGINNFYWYLRLGKETIDYLFGWIGKIFFKKNISLRCHPPP